ncbi:MAG: hypothetical protein ABIJ45_01655 [Candidatus Zixiibacteriota bacterium]
MRRSYLIPMILFLIIFGTSNLTAQMCEIGDKVMIRNTAGQKFTGCFTELKPNAIVIFNQMGDLEFNRNNIDGLYVYKGGQSVKIKNGAFIGGAIGGSIFFYNFFKESDRFGSEDNRDKTEFKYWNNLGVVVLTTIIGALIGSLIVDPIPVDKNDLFKIESGLKQFPSEKPSYLCLRLSYNF